MRRGVLMAASGVALVAAAVVAVGWWVSERSTDNANGSVVVRDLRTVVGQYVSVNDVHAPAPVLAELPVRLTVAKDRISAHAGCNSMQGSARVKDGRLVVSDLAVTEIGCPPDVAAQEQWVLTMLQARPRIERSGPYLSLSWDGYWLGLSSDPTDLPSVSSSA
jgi:heat shock protein HslJ